MFFRLLHCLLTISRFKTNFQEGVVVEKFTNQFANCLIIVCEQNALGYPITQPCNLPPISQ
jgi:hypothetical protein